jgi:hypothetical protein
MKIAFLILIILVSSTVTTGQATSSAVQVITTYSQNEKFYLKSIPYDDEFPTLRGRTSVYEKGNATPLYVFERGFDSVDKDSNNLILSNNGEIIFYAIPWEANEQKEGLKSVTIYRNGKILRSFTEAEINGCDKKKERCSLLYSNYDRVVDREKSNWGTKNYKRAFKEGTDEKEKFLSDFPIFSFDDTVYLIDSKKQVHLFDLKEGTYLRSDSFDNVFEEMKAEGRFNRVELQTFTSPTFLDFPRLKDGRDPYRSLANSLGMKSASIVEKKDDQYKLYSFKLNSNISRDGSLEIENIEFWGGKLPQEQVIEFFKANKFDSSAVPGIFDKWNLGDEYFYFRQKSNVIARKEKQEEIRENRKELDKRMTLETINGVYIPKNLGECFIELDKVLTEIDKKEMLALPRRDDMILYHMGLGMWMRNNWGLWGGSRLQKYFTDKGIHHPDEMSSVILFHYYDWLNGRKETWKDWETNPKQRLINAKQKP